MTRVVFAPDSFKGSVPAAKAARALAAGWAVVEPEVTSTLLPMADGGEGTLAAIASCVPGSRPVPVTVMHPRGARFGQVRAAWLLLPPDASSPRGTGVVELESTAGIELLGAELDPWRAGTSGFGDAIRSALDHGVSRLVLAIGSSASTDAGVGMLSALGAVVSTHDGALTTVAASLSAITSIDLTTMRALPPGGVSVLTDVTSPLLGETGAAALFGPQKGFRQSEVRAVDRALNRAAELLAADPHLPGSGAAGGTGLALSAWGANLVPGAPSVAQIIGLEAAISGAEFVVTGEGSYDRQSALGKVPGFVLDLATANGKPAGIVAGRLAHDARGDGFRAAISLAEMAGGAEAAMADPLMWLTRAGAQLASQSRLGARRR